MKNFITTFLATTFAFSIVILGKQVYDDYRAAKAKEAVASAVGEAKEAAEELAEHELNVKVAALVKNKEKLDSWQIIDNTNPVTSYRTITISKLSTDYEGALVFRCYDNRDGFGRRYDNFFVFPEDLFGYKDESGWVTYQLDEEKPVASSVTKAINDHSASFFVVSDKAGYKEMPSIYGGWLDSIKEYRPEFYKTLNHQPSEYFDNVLDAQKLTIVAGQHGMISEQTMIFDIVGIREAIKPVIEYCERKSLI